MAQIEVDLPDRITGELNRLVESGEFLNRERAIEDLLQRGVSAYDIEEEPGGEEMDEELFTQAVDDQVDPAMQEDHGEDEPTF
jgi:metal-responsive CopG/Arc/MetJ family transcriptional regulator